MQLLEREQVALLALAAGVADHAGRAADEGDRPMARLLKPPQHQQRQQAADVQAVGRRIEAAIERSLTTREPAAELLGVRRLVDEAAPGEISK